VTHRIRTATVGLLFGMSLIMLGIKNPIKVIEFLNLAGPWDLSFACLTGGVILVGIFASIFTERVTENFLGSNSKWPSPTSIDPHLVGGTLMFGESGDSRVLRQIGDRRSHC